MAELIFLACLGVGDGNCHTHRIGYSNVSVMTCMMGAQGQLARWQQEHRDWSIAEWSCRDPRDSASDGNESASL